MLPWEIFKIGLSKMLFTAFPGPELVDQEKFSQKNEIYELEITIFISVKSFVFLVDSKLKSNLKEFTNP